MTVYVLSEGKLVEKGTAEPRQFAKRANFPTPNVSRMETYESPIDGRDVTSWGARDREMRENDVYDPRDLPKDHVYSHGRGTENQHGQRTEPDDA